MGVACGISPLAAEGSWLVDDVSGGEWFKLSIFSREADLDGDC